MLGNFPSIPLWYFQFLPPASPHEHYNSVIAQQLRELKIWYFHRKARSNMLHRIKIIWRLRLAVGQFQMPLWRLRFHSLRRELSRLGEPKCLYEEKLSCLPGLHIIWDRYKSGTGSTPTTSPGRINSDRLGSWKQTKLNEIETFTHLKVKISVKSGPN